MNFSAPFIHRPVMTIFTMLAIIIAGMAAFKKLPVSDLPNIEQPTIDVRANYEGATPETMVKTITIPLEKELFNVSGVKEIRSRTRRGSTSITLNFELDKDLNVATREVEQALKRAEGVLPRDMESKPTYSKEETNQEHILFLILNSSTSSIAELRDYSDKYIEPKLSRIEGVSHVDTFGAPFAVKIQINPDLLAARGITLDQVIHAVQLNNADMPLGMIRTGTRILTLEVAGELHNAKDFENIVIAPGPVFLKDIGSVTDGAESDREFHYLTKSDNSVALILGLKKINGANTVSISQAVNQILPELQKELPQSMQFKLWFDKAVWIEKSIFDVELSLVVAFVLVALVIFLSLGRISEALIPTIALPMSLIGTFVVMFYLGFSLNILTLLALTLSVGFVVDDAIVVLENIVRHKENGESRLQASLLGSKEICFTVISMTVSLVAVFIPILFMGGMNGRLFHEFSVTLAAAILVSGFISLSLTPMLCSRILTTKHYKTQLQIWSETANAKFVKVYGKSLQWCFRYPKTILLTAFACFLISIPLFRMLPVELFPKEDHGFIISMVSLPKGLSDAKAAEYQTKIESLIQANPHVESVVDLLFGESQLFLTSLVDHEHRPHQDVIIKQIQEGIDAIPGTQAHSLGWQLVNMDVDMSSGGNYKFVLRGMDGNEVEESAELLKKKLQGNSTFSFVNLNVKRDEPKLQITVNNEQANRYGISKKDIQGVLQQAFTGGSIANINKNGNQYKVYLELEKEYRTDPASLAKLNIQTKTGQQIPLKSVASWSETLGSPTLHRRDQLASATINFALDDAVPLKQGIETIEKIAAETLPATVSGRLDGSAAMISSTLQNTLLLLLASVVVMYIVLGILYESFIHPLTILSSLPIAGLGGVLTLLLLGEPLSLFSMMGFLLLVGIVKKNGIMIVDFALEARKAGSMTAQDAIYQGCMVRFRPIMMTTIAAIMGAIPIALGICQEGGTRQGLGLVIAGGLLFSQMLTLYVTPVIYIMLSRFERKSALNFEGSSCINVSVSSKLA